MMDFAVGVLLALNALLMWEVLCQLEAIRKKL